MLSRSTKAEGLVVHVALPGERRVGMIYVLKRYVLPFLVGKPESHCSFMLGARP